MFKQSNIDFKMAAGFSGLLFLIVAIGLIGIWQIQDLSRIVDILGENHVPMQSAIFEMKSSNTKYAMGVRSYMFWQGAKFLDAAALGEKLSFVHSTAEKFDRELQRYAALATTPEQKDWIRIIQDNEAELRRLGDKIIVSVKQMDSADPEARKKLEGAVNRQLMDFENKVFRVDAYLDSPLVTFNLQEIEAQLKNSRLGKARSVSLLTWSLVIGLLLGGQTALLIYRRNKSEKEHRELLYRKMIRVEEEERNNLSLQVHDQMGQDLSALKIYLGLIDKDLPPEMAGSREKIEKTKKILDGLMAKTHNISEMLRPPELDDLGLVESIAALVLQYQKMIGCRCHYVKPEEALKLSSEHSLVLYRVVQEALTNSAKYSRAKNIEVVLGKKDDNIYLGVSDDGVGFDYEEYLRRPFRREVDKIKLGLQGLRERIELFGGRLNIQTHPGAGTRLEVVLPIV